MQLVKRMGAERDKPSNCFTRRSWEAYKMIILLKKGSNGRQHLCQVYVHACALGLLQQLFQIGQIGLR